jgi:hypothetical protein
VRKIKPPAPIPHKDKKRYSRKETKANDKQT